MKRGFHSGVAGRGFTALIGTILVLGGALVWWLIAGSSLAPNEILVTYEDGETCKWVDWSFRIRRQVSNNTARGAVLITGPGTTEQADDTTLRVFGSSGEKLAIAGQDLREMSFYTTPDENNSSSNRVSSLTIATAADRHRFLAEELPKFSRSRVLVPVASHYFPEHSDDYMSWGNVRMTLAGTASPDCSTDREISLTRPGHPKKRTPAHIQFAGA